MKGLLPVLFLAILWLGGIGHTLWESTQDGVWPTWAAGEGPENLLFTLAYSLVSAVLAGGLGAALAVTVPLSSAYRPRASRFWLALPPITVGFLVVLVLGPTGILASLVAPLTGGSPLPSLVHAQGGSGIIFAAVLKETAFVVLWVRASLVRLDPRLLETAQMLGGRRWQNFVSLQAPLVAPATVVATLMVFLYSLGAWELPYLLGPSSPQALSLAVLNAHDYGSAQDRLTASAALTLVVGLSLVVSAWSFRWERRVL